MSPDSGPSSRQVLSLERGMRCLAALGRRGGEASFSVLQAASGDLPDPTMARLLRSLGKAGLIENLGRGAGYRLTPLASSLAQGVLGREDLAALCRPATYRLAQAAGLSCGVFVPDGESVRMVCKTELPDGVHMIAEGQVREELCGHGCAQVMSAWSEELRLRYRRILRRDLRLDGPSWRARMEEIRRHGLHVGHGEEVHGPAGRHRRSLLLRIAAPLTAGAEGPLVAAISISALTDQPQMVATPGLLRLVKRQAERLSEELALYRPPAESVPLSDDDVKSAPPEADV